MTIFAKCHIFMKYIIRKKKPMTPIPPPLRVMSFLDSPWLEFPKILYILELTVKECKVIFYTFDFLSTGSDDDDDDDDEVMIEKFSLNQLKIWYIIA